MPTAVSNDKVMSMERMYNPRNSGLPMHKAKVGFRSLRAELQQRCTGGEKCAHNQ